VLTIIVPGEESFNEETEEFVTVGDITLELEHSLVSLSKWESKFEKAFLSETPKTEEEVLAYIEFMILTPDFPRGISSQMSSTNIEQINAYINAKMTATWFSDEPGGPRSTETITSELVYYWMTAFHIPFSCETWHFNRLLTLIRICNVKNAPEKKLSATEIAARNRRLNAERQKQLGTSG
jgi:hypothetical protein